MGPAREDLADVVERLRHGDQRFARLRAQLNGGVVLLSGSVGHDGDAMEFAQCLSRVPGVERVVIGDVRTEITLPGR